MPGGVVAAALGPADDGEEAHALPVQPGALLPRREVDVRLRPLARPVVLGPVEAGRAQPVLPGQRRGCRGSAAGAARASPPGTGRRRTSAPVRRGTARAPGREGSPCARRPPAPRWRPAPRAPPRSRSHQRRTPSQLSSPDTPDDLAAVVQRSSVHRRTAVNSWLPGGTHGRAGEWWVTRATPPTPPDDYPQAHPPPRAIRGVRRDGDTARPRCGLLSGTRFRPPAEPRRSTPR